MSIIKRLNILLWSTLSLGLTLVVSFGLVVGFKEELGFSSLVVYNSLITFLALSGVALFIFGMVLIEKKDRLNNKRKI